jgi:IclR family pca regulon transcriptional regulator
MTNEKDIVGAFAKGLRVLECFNADHPRLTISDVSEMTGFDRATSRRFLLTLHHLGYAGYDGKHFTPEPRILRLGMGALAALPLPQIVQPWLDQLSEKIGQSCSVAILDDTEIVYIARAAQRRVMSIGLMPGSRLPAHCSSLGRVLLAALPDAEAQAVVERSDLTPRTAHSKHDPQAILEEIARVRAQGFALIEQEIELGLCSLAVPIIDAKGRTVAALNTGMPALHATPEACETVYLPALRATRDGLRRVLA